MKKILLKIKSFINKGPTPYEAKGFRSGFALLFAVTLAAILLSIALGVTSVAFKELQFSTSAKDTNDAFFAADTGAECALVNDKSTGSRFTTGSSTLPTCNGNSNIVATENPSKFWTFVVLSLNGGKGCAKVTVDKRGPITQVISKGRNNGSSGGCVSTSNTVERQLELTY